MKKVLVTLLFLIALIMSAKTAFANVEDTAKSIENFDENITIDTTDITSELSSVFSYDPRLAMYYKGYKAQAYFSKANLQIQYTHTDIPLNNIYVASTEEELGKLIRQAMLYSKSQIAFVTVGIPQPNDKISKIVKYITEKDPITSMGYRGFSMSYLDTKTDNYVSYVLQFNYDIDATTLNEMKKATEEKACQIVASNIAMDMPPYMKIYTIHNYIVNNTVYAGDYETNPNPVYHTAYGSLVNNVAVCDGYSNGLQLLANIAGVDSMVISGTSKGSNHSWNIVKLDSDYYHIDSTWDDPYNGDGINYLSHYYYNVTDSQISADHSWDTGAYPGAKGTIYNHDKTCQLIVQDSNKYTKGYESFNSVYNNYPPLSESTRNSNYSTEPATAPDIKPTAVLDNLGDHNSIIGNDLMEYFEITAKTNPILIVLLFVIVFVLVTILDLFISRVIKRPKVVKKAMKTIKKMSFVNKCSLTGSYKNKTYDKHSNLNLTVKIKNVPPNYAIYKIKEKLCQSQNVIWYHYDTEYLPHKFILSIFAKNNNPFLYIDICIETHDYTIDYEEFSSQNMRWCYIAKLWMICFKNYVRGNNFDYEFRKMLYEADISECESYSDGFRQVLNILIEDEYSNHYYIGLLINEYQKYFGIF